MGNKKKIHERNFDQSLRSFQQKFYIFTTKNWKGEYDK